MSAQPETAEETTEDAAVISGSAKWLAALLGTTTTPAGYTVALFHDSPSPVEHFTMSGRPVEGDDAPLLLAILQYSMLHHQVAHFASTASDEEWAAAIARVTELGDYDSDLTVAAMQEGRAQVQAAKSGPDGLKAALQAAVGDTADIRVIRGAEELKQILAGLSDGQPEPETEAGGIRAKAISYL